MKILSYKCRDIFIDKATVLAIHHNIIDRFQIGRICLTICLHYSWQCTIALFQCGELHARSPYLREAQLDASLFEGLGELLQLLQVAGFLQDGRVQPFWGRQAVGEGLERGGCYRTGRCCRLKAHTVIVTGQW